MGLEHLSTAPILQGNDANGCWAASFAWWLQAVLKRDYTFEDILMMYKKWSIYKEEDEESEGFGAMTALGVQVMFSDQRFRIVGEASNASKLDVKRAIELLNISPVLIAYFDPKVNAYHMNVLVSQVNSINLENGIFVMDPSETSFQVRKLDYYKGYNNEMYLGYYIREASSEPQYAYEVTPGITKNK